MICIMPIKSGEVIDSRVIAGIASQTMPVDLLISSLPPIVNARSREISINHNRNYLQSIVSTDEAYVVLLDSDVVMSSDAVESMYNYLQANPTIDCVAIDTKGNPSDQHIVTACAMIKTRLYKEIDFMSQPGICQCSLIAMRGMVKYLQGIRASEIDKL